MPCRFGQAHLVSLLLPLLLPLQRHIEVVFQRLGGTILPLTGAEEAQSTLKLAYCEPITSCLAWRPRILRLGRDSLCDPDLWRQDYRLLTCFKLLSGQPSKDENFMYSI